jgi:hypothetical protein
MKPIKIKKSFEYEIEITDEGYSINVEPGVSDDLACLLISKNIIERFQVDLKEAKKMKMPGSDPKFIAERLTKMVQTAYGLQVVAEQVIRYVMVSVKKEAEAKELEKKSKSKKDEKKDE